MSTDLDSRYSTATNTSSSNEYQHNDSMVLLPLCQSASPSLCRLHPPQHEHRTVPCHHPLPQHEGTTVPPPLLLLRALHIVFPSTASAFLLGNCLLLHLRLPDPSTSNTLSPSSVVYCVHTSQ
ncbi:hypothetical protein B0H16DRAFT_1719272 [Mycena metata]|uniref:Uncharacterized protein n=1 Tax=Mycena metata TaxID=1033252 RepID=A0AAD7NH97_9AGAR|nr:hypothetical protein B0H16DRAFT_1719272 [Mycena metata]